MNDMPTALHSRQIELEEESTSLGLIRYQKNLERSDDADTGPGRKLVTQALEAVAAGITAWVTEATSGKPGRRHSAVKWLEHLNPTAVAYLTCTVAVNTMGLEKPTFTGAASRLGQAIERDVRYQAFNQAHPGLYRVIQKQLKKSTSERHAVAVMEHAIAVADTKAQAEGGAAVPHWNLEEQECVAIGALLLDLFVSCTGLATIEVERLRATQTIAMFRATPAIQDWIEKAHESAAMFMPVWMPMLVPPKPWTTPNDGGYLTNIGGRADLVRSRNRAYKSELNHADMPEVYAAVNAIQATGWKVNKPVLEVMELVWAAGGGLGDLPTRDMAPLPATPDLLVTDPDYYKEHHAEEFKSWKRQRAEIYESNARGTSQRVACAQKLGLARKFAEEEAIYFPHNLDFRGRCYPIPSILSPQGDDASKALLTFSEGVELGEDGAFWLAVHLANTFGVDKVPFPQRVKWVKDNEEMILDCAMSPLDGCREWAKADSPFCALAACIEWLGYKVNGESHVSHLPIALDGSCNGLQNFSAMLRDPVGGAATNLVPALTPADIYTEVLKLVNKVVRKDSEAGNADAMFWDGVLCRSIVKQPVMTLPYGVTVSGMRNQVESNARKQGLSPSGDNCKYLAGVLWKAIGEVVVAARHAMDWLKQAAKVASAADAPIHWTTPAGFPVLQEYRCDIARRVEVHIGGKRMEITRTIEGTKLDPRRQGLGISPNFVHSCDASHMMLTLNIALENGITSFAMIHDSYGAHAGKAGILAASLRQAFLEQYSADVLGNFRQELIDQLPPEIASEIPELPPSGDLDLSLVLDSLYFFA
jgi:DNA-directed RNA polymerase